ncbi:methylmalonyl-CoA mutase family protein [Carboxylicivirga sp. RSCT41]|uniref:methylmalonyl-CoA mutase family protein n=1 Tax=Carboxylicivirga agarovorans TaxID=3417570 RepID=UPI003D35655A
MKDHIYKAAGKIRIVTATSLFDGHDASINIMRRIMQASGAEVIHLGHNRSVQEIVDCAIQEDVQAIAVTSYQGGHLEFYKYMYDLLQQKGAGHIKIVGGGGGVILPHEQDELHQYGIARIFSPDDGRKAGLQGMINEVLKLADYQHEKLSNAPLPVFSDKMALARFITLLENSDNADALLNQNILKKAAERVIPVIGITGTGGAGKSSLIDELVRRLLMNSETLKIAIVSVDPSKRKSGGALLGDRIRMNSIHHPNVFMRSMATRGARSSVSTHLNDCVSLLKAAGADLIILETSGIGQADSQIIDYANISLYVMTPEYGAPSQLEKIDMLDFADFVVINKSDKKGAEDALRDVKKQVQRNKQLWDVDVNDMPVFLTNASNFYDQGINRFCQKLKDYLNHHYLLGLKAHEAEMTEQSFSQSIIPSHRVRYLAEISETIRAYNAKAEEQSKLAGQLYALHQTIEIIKKKGGDTKQLEDEYKKLDALLSDDNRQLITKLEALKKAYADDVFTFKVRNKEIKIETHTSSLSNTRVPKIAVPKYKNWEDILRWQLKENFPGHFPFAAGVFPFRREYEDPTRMFAGEGSPERTNKRFHYLSEGQKAKRLSTAFDSVTLYGENPDARPDIYGKVGNSGVSTATLDDIKKLYSGFDLSDPLTSVSMTINGPAPVLMAFFLNAAIDQQCEKFIQEAGIKIPLNEGSGYADTLPEGNNGLGLKLLGISGDEIIDGDNYERIKKETLKQVRGTVQADILKEDQAQNTCIYSVDFSLKLMGDIQEYFIRNQVRNFYSVSISGYHIAEAGANPLTQLAFTLANGLTYVEYYLSRGMHIDDFAPNLSFFFSNGIDPEFSVIGRVARIIWAKAIKYKYGGNEKSQKLKYHIQTSGRSLHAQEIEFNDIRTTLQALYAIYDNCNSLHTNAYDEAITTPTEESVRRAMAIQLIINRELGLAKNQNTLQGSFIIEELTELVEEAVLSEFERISDRGGVLGAMETNYQRSKIQEESLHYEKVKNTGELPLIGVNTFLSKSGSPTILPQEVIRSTEVEKQRQLKALNSFHDKNKLKAREMLMRLKEAALNNDNVFEALMDTVKYCSLGQITQALFEVGGKYRRNM